MNNEDLNQERFKKIAQLLSEVSNLKETDMHILLTLLKNSKVTNSELADILDFKDGNSVTYHTRNMQKEGLIDKYTIIPNWKRAGLSTEFIILAEAENEEQLLQIEKEHVLMADEYLSNIGEIVVTPTISGCVILQNVYHCFGDKTMAVISGRATSDQDAAVYCKNYLVNRYPDIKISMLLNKYKTVDEFFIDKNAVSKLKELFQVPATKEVTDTLENLKSMSSED
ncbi:winged helix-turn-helix transcriptional regulator [Methanococcoides seepicolus]|jgi:DNA-binding Lrp family transcriptional regulator|uniref:Winged helix-turn-helix transcriptional regulator n=1 Tax=Methanococcoides seepicolus TaxID=2828780 RepID=A0A9E4ZI57_9EURY|nr:winged helix-turn-helix transcriptional regulator [Methanococcoides seepicolus]MCM1987877.1 winged helix-turn-helix transcriptional regulator [Methanococcoides seepicolus]